MKLDEAIKELKDRDYNGWIAKRKDPNKRISKEDFIEEWYHSEITNSVILSDNTIEIEEKRTTVPNIMPATRYMVVGLEKNKKNEK